MAEVYEYSVYVDGEVVVQVEGPDPEQVYANGHNLLQGLQDEGDSVIGSFRVLGGPED